MAAGTSEAGAPSTPSASSSAGTSSGSGGSGSKIVLILCAVNLVVTLGMLAVFYLSFQREKMRPSVEDISTQAAGGEGSGEKKAEGEGGHAEGGENPEREAAEKKNLNFGKMVTLEQFTINLSTPGSTSARFVRVNISLEVPTDEVETEVGAKSPQIRNAIIDLFNSKKPADLATSEGRNYVKDEIKNAINSFLLSGKIKGVFFTSFALAG